jgi:hypothetical protein
MKSTSQADDLLDDDSDSQLLKLGRAALKKTNSLDPAVQTVAIRQTMLDPVVSPDPKHPFQLVVSLALNFDGRSQPHHPVGADRNHWKRLLLPCNVLRHPCNKLLVKIFSDDH